MWKQNTFMNYEFILGKFQNNFENIKISSISSEDIMEFMSEMSDGTKQSSNTEAIRWIDHLHA